MVSSFFSKRELNPATGKIEIFDSRYILLRGAAFSVEFFALVRRMFGEDNTKEADLFSTSLLYDLAHVVGKSDAANFHAKIGLTDPIAKLSAGPVHFSHSGWAFVNIFPESSPSPDDDYFLVYSHPYSFECDAWQNSDEKANFPVCVMNAGYSSGWCEESFGLPLEAKEIACQALGDDECLFIMAPPHRLEEQINQYLQSHPHLKVHVTDGNQPNFFSRNTALRDIDLNKDHGVPHFLIEKKVLSYARELEASQGALRSKIAELKETAAAFKESEQRWRDLSNSTFEAIIITQDNTIIEVNKAATVMFGLAKKDLIDVEFDTLFEEKHREPIHKHFNKIEKKQYDTIACRGDKTVFFAELQHRKGNMNGKPILVTAIRDISERKIAHEKLRQLANFDTLTGLPNRMYFTTRVDKAISRSKEGIKHALLFIDLDNFKHINDSLGHPVGDVLLQKVSRLLSVNIRAADIIARLGGDEFTVWLENLPSNNVAATVASHLRDALSVPHDLAGHSVVATASIGVARFPEDGKNATELLRSADTAMYSAKKKGRNAFKFFTPAMNLQANRRLELEGLLREAIKEDAIDVNFQPKASFKTGKLVGVEVLARWNHPQKGYISPLDFVPVAEETGLIIDIGQLILKKSCRHARKWLDSKLHFGRIAVNLSPMQFQQKGLIASIDTILKQTKLPGELLEFEITEGAVVNRPESAIRLMHKIRERSIHLSIDDFGVGYSSLSYLRRFPVDTLKIDRSFIVDLDEKRDHLTLAASIISLGHILGLNVVAEGVETWRQVEVLKNMECDELQGYLYSKPLNSDDFTAFLKKSQNLYSETYDQ